LQIALKKREDLIRKGTLHLLDRERYDCCIDIAKKGVWHWRRLGWAEMKWVWWYELLAWSGATYPCCSKGGLLCLRGRIIYVMLLHSLFEAVMCDLVGGERGAKGEV
jgi:hypothetical protein